MSLTCGLLANLSAEPQRYQKAASVCVEVRMTDHLAGQAFTKMREEATRIWLRHRVVLRWTHHTPTECEAVVPITFDDNALQNAGGANNDAIALTVFLGSSRVVYVSVRRAFQTVARLRETSDLLSDVRRNLHGGMLLGRIVAHELGHVLLLTTSHAKEGLMRPVFGLQDALSADDRVTDLSAIQSHILSMRFSLIPLKSQPTFARSDR